MNRESMDILVRQTRQRVTEAKELLATGRFELQEALNIIGLKELVQDIKEQKEMDAQTLTSVAETVGDLSEAELASATMTDDPELLRRLREAATRFQNFIERD